MASALVSWQEIVQTIKVMPEINTVDDSDVLVIEDDVFNATEKNFYKSVAAIQGSEAPHLNRLRVAVFSSDIQQQDCYLKKIIDGTSALNRLCFLLDAELRLYELNREDSTQTVSADEFLRALAFGMMGVEPGMDAVLLIEHGHNHDFSAQQILEAFSKDDVSDETIFEILCKVGDLSIAAMLGTIIAARMAEIPVFMDTRLGLAAVAVLHRYRSDAAQHCVWLGQDSGFENEISLLQSPHIQLSTVDTAMPGYIALMKLLQLKAICQCMQPRRGIHVHMAVGERHT